MLKAGTECVLEKLTDVLHRRSLKSWPRWRSFWPKLSVYSSHRLQGWFFFDWSVFFKTSKNELPDDDPQFLVYTVPLRTGSTTTPARSVMELRALTDSRPLTWSQMLLLFLYLDVVVVVFFTLLASELARSIGYTGDTHIYGGFRFLQSERCRNRRLQTKLS